VLTGKNGRLVLPSGDTRRSPQLELTGTQDWACALSLAHSALACAREATATCSRTRPRALGLPATWRGVSAPNSRENLALSRFHCHCACAWLLKAPSCTYCASAIVVALPPVAIEGCGAAARDGVRPGAAALAGAAVAAVGAAAVPRDCAKFSMRMRASCAHLLSACCASNCS